MSSLVNCNLSQLNTFHRQFPDQAKFTQDHRERISMLKEQHIAFSSYCKRHLICGIRFSFQVKSWEDFCNFFRLKVNHDYVHKFVKQHD